MLHRLALLALTSAAFSGTASACALAYDAPDLRVALEAIEVAAPIAVHPVVPGDVNLAAVALPAAPVVQQAPVVQPPAAPPPTAQAPSPPMAAAPQS